MSAKWILQWSTNPPKTMMLWTKNIKYKKQQIYKMNYLCHRVWTKWRAVWRHMYTWWTATSCRWTSMLSSYLYRLFRKKRKLSVWVQGFSQVFFRSSVDDWTTFNKYIKSFIIDTAKKLILCMFQFIRILSSRPWQEEAT